MLETSITSLETLNQTINDELACVVYFSSPSCNVCQVLRPKVMQMLHDEYPNIKRLHVDISVTPDIAAQFSVLAAPTVILFLEGKEFVRQYRTISVSELSKQIARPYEMMMS